MHDTFPTSPVAQLDALFDLICVKLQLSPTAYNQADSRYKSVSDWLNDENSLLVGYEPNIYPQGSLNLGTTTKPVGRNEYDLDFVCEFRAIKAENCLNPLLLLDLIEERLNENEIYKKMLKRLSRCIRLIYANDFHMDILPACPHPASGLFGKTCVLVPDTKVQDWKHSNPLGYADWFRFKAREAFVNFKERNVKPLPEQQAYVDLATLQKVVQMMKRNRDISLSHLDEKERPISIVLTTLAARYYDGHPSPTVALLQILDFIINAVESESGERLVVLNPTNEDEDLSERWENEPKLYQTFVDWVHKLRRDLDELTEIRGIHNIEAKLKSMFSENLAQNAVKDFTEQLNLKRQNGTLSVARGSGLIVPATVAQSTAIKANTFHGR